MKNIQETTFTVYRDGQLDKVFYRQKRVATIKQAMKQAVWHVLRGIGRALTNMVRNIALIVRVKLYDAQNGTNYYDQMVQQYERHRDQQFARKVGLHA